MGFDTTSILLVLAPFLLLPLAGWLGGRGARYARLLALFPAALTAYFVYVYQKVATAGPFTVSVPWVPDLGLSLSFLFDGLGLLFALLITGIGALIVLYAASYLGGHPLSGRFQLILFAFMGSMLGLVLSDNIVLLFVFWELTGITSYFLIGFDHERREARQAAMQALLVTGTGGLALLAGGVAITQATGTPSLSAMLEAGTTLGDHPAHAVFAGLILLAALTKSAQFPFHFWLPNAMQAPTPVSAYLHSATMVKAGVYLVARMTPLLGGAAIWTAVLVTAGALTMLGGAYRALLETDLKRILAYTTVSALGVMMLSLGLGTRTGIAAALVYLVAHACYKGALFLVTGAVDHETGTRDIRELGGLGRSMPRTATAAVAAAVSMAGVPPLFGFIAKESLYGSLAESGVEPAVHIALLTVAVSGSAMMGASALTVGVAPFAGRITRPAAVHEPTFALWMAPAVLALAGVIAGLAPAIVDAPLSLAATAVTGEPEQLDLALWHGLTFSLLLSAITLALTLVLYRYREPVRAGARLRGLGTERLYRMTLGGVDALGRKLAPALQSASLRSYVRVIIVTGVAFVLLAIALSTEFPGIGRWMPIRPHEAGVALLIAVGAISAATARSTMAAVLSLGAVGYGVALVYVLFGAPDLATTQFAVETLTVIIFVLVFYQFPRFEDGLTWPGRIRDAAIAIAAGTTIALLVILDATSGVPSRLAGYFLDAAPQLAHGLNVVNVILVDFRAFDTMGEITVLVTVAIGVRALLQIGKEWRP